MHKKFVAPEKLNVFMLLFLTQHVPSSPCQPHVQPTCLFFFHTVYRNQSLVTYFCFTYCKSIDPENVRDSRAGLGAWQHDWQFWLDVLINLWHESKNEYHPRWQRVWSKLGELLCLPLLRKFLDQLARTNASLCLTGSLDCHMGRRRHIFCFLSKKWRLSWTSTGCTICSLSWIMHQSTKLKQSVMLLSSMATHHCFFRLTHYSWTPLRNAGPRSRLKSERPLSQVTETWPNEFKKLPRR